MSAIFLLLVFSVQAQEDSLPVNTRRLGLCGSVGLNRNTLLDNAVSPMLYSGNGTAFGSGLLIERGVSSDRVSLTYQHARISRELDNDSRADLYRAQAEWIRTYRLNQANQKIGLFAGGQVLSGMTALNHEQWTNNGFSYCFNLSLGPAFTIDIPYLGSKKNLRMKWDLSLPLMAYVVRPGISSLLPEGAIHRGDLGVWGYVLGGRLTSLHEYLNLRSRLCMEIMITPRIGMQLDYRWVYQQYNVNNDYQSANHLLSAGISYRINKP